MGIKDRLVQLMAAAVSVVGFIKRHKRASIAVAVALLIAGPLLTGTGGETFFLNLVGLGIVALVVRRIVRANEKKQARQANRRLQVWLNPRIHQPMASASRYACPGWRSGCSSRACPVLDMGAGYSKVYSQPSERCFSPLLTR